MAELSTLTNSGAAKLAVASPESPVRIAYLAVGDGAGGYPDLLPTWTALAGEVWRGAASEPMRDNDDARMLVFESVIPVNVGGFFIREMGLFDEDGDLIAVSQCSPVEKPSAASSAKVTLTAVFRLLLDSAAQTSLIINDQPYIDHAGLSGRGAPDAHPLAAITGLTGVHHFTGPAVSLPQDISGAVCVRVGQPTLVTLPSVAALREHTEIVIYVQRNSASTMKIAPAAGDMIRGPYDLYSPSDDGSLGDMVAGWWVKLRSVSLIDGETVAGWEVVGDGFWRRQSSESMRGTIVIATQDMTNAGVADYAAVTPKKLAARTATEVRTGLIEIATQAEVNAGTDDDRAVTAKKLKDGGFWPVGKNQTWQKPSRSSGTTYTNTSGRDILVVVSVKSSAPAADQNFKAYINDFMIAHLSESVAISNTITLLVRNGEGYRVETSGPLSVYEWVELR